MRAQQPTAENPTLFLNVRVFDGKSATLSAPSSVLVRGNTIVRVSRSPIDASAIENLTVFNGQGRVLMPGLIDAHWHAFMAATPQTMLMTADASYLHLLAARQAEATLMRGFTTVRDMGGPVFGLKRAIDEGAMIGPRIYPSGAFISQTSGHGDFRFSFEVPRTLGGPLSHSEVEGIAAISRQPRRSAATSQGAVGAWRQSDQADGRQRRRLSLQSDRIHPVHRTRDSRRGRGG